jgi:hypothetical protein
MRESFFSKKVKNIGLCLIRQSCVPKVQGQSGQSFQPAAFAAGEGWIIGAGDGIPLAVGGKQSDQFLTAFRA